MFKNQIKMCHFTSLRAYKLSLSQEKNETFLVIFNHCAFAGKISNYNFQFFLNLKSWFYSFYLVNRLDTFTVFISNVFHLVLALITFLEKQITNGKILSTHHNYFVGQPNSRSSSSLCVLLSRSSTKRIAVVGEFLES